jgi:hypothetical protein
MKDKIKVVVQSLLEKIYDEGDKKFKFPPSVDTVFKKIVIPAGAFAVASFLYDLYNNSPVK